MSRRVTRLHPEGYHITFHVHLREWDRPSRPRRAAKNNGPKRRWELLHETAHLLKKAS